MRENDNEWDPERTSIVVKILLDHLKMNDLIFPYLATKMEEGGKPSTVNDFISKLIFFSKDILSRRISKNERYTYFIYILFLQFTIPISLA